MSVFSNSAYDEHELVTFCSDSQTGLRAIIAVHNTNLGPGVGGCRMFNYQNDESALYDVLRLSRGMTYKSALAGLPMGGGKSVIIGDPAAQKSDALFMAMGEFIESLSGRYVAAEDSGTGVDDMRQMARRTAHVSGLDDNEFGGDPSPSTAWGVFLSIRAAVAHRIGSKDLENISVAIQGLGHVGYYLANYLISAGARVYGADVNRANIERAVRDLGVQEVATDQVLSLPVDVVAPCAMGAVWHAQSVEALRAGIVCGAANNQLSSTLDDARLRDAGILYCPDFLVNAGGIIDVHHQRVGSDADVKREHIERIESTLLEVLKRAEQAAKPTQEVAEQLARERFQNTDTSPIAA